jgi:CRP-like cAMP-binding protein
MEQDAHWTYLGFLRSGALSAIIGSAIGRDQHLFDILPGDTLGDIETIDGGRTIARIAVTSAVAHVVVIPRGIVLSASLADAVFARKLATICAQRARMLSSHLSTHVAYPAIARVAAAILPYAAPDEGLVTPLEALQRITQSQLAVIAGTAKEVAARAVAELEAAGALERTQGHIARIDRAKLIFDPNDPRRVRHIRRAHSHKGRPLKSIIRTWMRTVRPCTAHDTSNAIIRKAPPMIVTTPTDLPVRKEIRPPFRSRTIDRLGNTIIRAPGRLCDVDEAKILEPLDADPRRLVFVIAANDSGKRIGTIDAELSKSIGRKLRVNRSCHDRRFRRCNGRRGEGCGIHRRCRRANSKHRRRRSDGGRPPTRLFIETARSDSRGASTLLSLLANHH